MRLWRQKTDNIVDILKTCSMVLRKYIIEPSVATPQKAMAYREKGENIDN